MLLEAPTASGKTLDPWYNARIPALGGAREIRLVLVHAVLGVGRADQGCACGAMSIAAAAPRQRPAGDQVRQDGDVFIQTWANGRGQQCRCAQGSQKSGGHALDRRSDRRSARQGFFDRRGHRRGASEFRASVKAAASFYPRRAHARTPPFWRPRRPTMPSCKPSRRKQAFASKAGLSSPVRMSSMRD